MSKPGKQNFWTTLPGLLTALAGLVTAVGGFWAVIQSKSPTPTTAQTLAINEFNRKDLLERTSYKILHGSSTIELTAVNVRAKKRILKVSIGLTGEQPATFELVEGKPATAVLGGRDYWLEVHGFTDHKDGKDLASFTLRPK